MKQYAKAITFWVLALALAPGIALGFNSGSTGADGAFNPTVNTQLPLPPSGIFNFTSVNIPSGVTVTFQKNTTNTPVTILASGNVTIVGTISVRGTLSKNVGAAGDGNIGDDGVPGVGGPGGFDGGRGGLSGQQAGGAGLGPGGGLGGSTSQTPFCGFATVGGGGGGFGASADAPCFPSGAGAYGSSLLLPLIGGSGGGGGSGGTNFGGAGGGGGGGAILIAASDTVNVAGSILADGGSSGDTAGSGCGSPGGGGSGGGIRIVATTISGDGDIVARAGTTGGVSCPGVFGGTAGAVGRIRLESESFTRTQPTTPPFTAGAPSSVFVAGFPTLTISSVAGVAAPAAPTGNADITLPASTPNPVTVVFTTTGVPVGNTVRLTVTPASGGITSVISPALTGSTASATASVSVNLSPGPSVLSATTTFTIVAALGDVLAPFAQGERVEKITLVAILGKPNKAILITVSGKEFEVPAAVLASGG